MNRVERTITAAALGAVLALGTGPVLAQAPTNEPGYVDFSVLSGQMGATPEVNLNFGGAMLGMFAEGLRESDPDLADLLGGLTGLRVTVYEDVDAEAVRPHAADLATRLTGQGWEAAMNVRDDSTHVDMLMRTGDNRIRGLALIVTEASGSAVFINVVGDLDPAAMGRLISGTGMNLNITEALGALAQQAEGQAGNKADNQAGSEDTD